MYGVLFAPFAKFLQLYLSGHQFLILGRPVIYALAGAAGQFEKSIL